MKEAGVSSGGNESSNEQSGNEKVREAVVNIVLGEERCLSLDDLLDIKGEPTKDHNTRQVVKRWLERNFGDNIVFLTTQNNLSKVIVSREVWAAVSSGIKPLNSSIISNDDSSTIKEAGELLQKVVIDYLSDAEPIPWPPTV